MAEREGNRRRMAAAPPGLLASARWQRENPMIKLAGLGAMAARESNKLPSAATRVQKNEHGAPLKRGASGRIMTLGLSLHSDGSLVTWFQ